MKLELHKMEEYLEKKSTLKLSKFLKEKIEEMPENLYLNMNLFYEQKGKKMPSNHYIYLLFNEDRVIGFRHFLVYLESKSAELFAIAVDSEFQRQGYAKKMINESINFLISLDINKIKVPLIKSSDSGIVTLANYYSNTIKQEYTDIEWSIEIPN